MFLEGNETKYLSFCVFGFYFFSFLFWIVPLKYQFYIDYFWSNGINLSEKLCCTITFYIREKPIYIGIFPVCLRIFIDFSTGSISYLSHVHCWKSGNIRDQKFQCNLHSQKYSCTVFFFSQMYWLPSNAPKYTDHQCKIAIRKMSKEEQCLSKLTTTGIDVV